jgi:hypothetical protein
MTEAAKQQFIEIIPPVVTYQDSQPSRFESAKRPSTLDGKRISLLANWKPISLPFIEVFAEQLAKKTPLKIACARYPNWQFTHPERVAKISPEVDDLARQCDLMLSGVGD